jgi:hypothetical protein
LILPALRARKINFSNHFSNSLLTIKDVSPMICLPIRFHGRLLTRLMAAALLVGFMGTHQAAWAGFQPKFSPGQKTLAGRRVGLATRGPLCNVTSPSPLALTTMVPVKLLGFSASPYPTFAWFVPKHTYSRVEFKLLQSTGETVYTTTIQNPVQNQINSLTLPKDAGIPPLQAGQEYQWAVKLVCDQQPSGEQQPPIVAQGWLAYEQPAATLSSQLSQATPEQRYELYASNGYWYDAFQTLLELRQSNPNDPVVTTQWGTLLNHEQIKLGQFVQ